MAELGGLWFIATNITKIRLQIMNHDNVIIVIYTTNIVIGILFSNDKTIQEIIILFPYIYFLVHVQCC